MTALEVVNDYVEQAEHYSRAYRSHPDIRDLGVGGLSVDYAGATGRDKYPEKAAGCKQRSCVSLAVSPLGHLGDHDVSYAA